MLIQDYADTKLAKIKKTSSKANPFNWTSATDNTQAHDSMETELHNK